MAYFQAGNNCRLYYVLNGRRTDRSPVVFLNGTTQTTLYWYSHFKYFQGRRRVIAYDARAQGQSDLGDTPLSLQQHVMDLKALLAHLEAPRVHLVGLSHGARVALELAGEHPERVDRVVLCSLGASSSGIAQAAVKAWLQVLQRSDLAAMAWSALPLVFGERFLTEHHTLLDKMVTAIVARNSRKALLAQLEALLCYPPPASPCAAIGGRLLVVSGADDLLVKPELALRLAEMCGSRHVVFPDVGHSLPAEAPARFNEVVAEFLAAEEPAAAPESS
jgi:3-oxoadipate enol-lactonase